MKIREIKVQASEGIEMGIIGSGRRIAISTSKIKKRMAIMKNRSENGIRDLEKGVKPHSKGEVFSRLKIVFFPRSLAVKMIASAIAEINRRKADKVVISFPGGQIFSLEVRYNFYTRKEGSSSVNGDEEEESDDINEVSISCGGFEAEVMFVGELEVN